MAIIQLGKTQCSLCSRIIQAGDDIVSTSHFISDRADPLWPFSDSAMHRSCFLAWDLRSQFIQQFNNAVGGITFGNGTFHHMEANGDISVNKRDV